MITRRDGRLGAPFENLREAPLPLFTANALPDFLQHAQRRFIRMAKPLSINQHESCLKQYNLYCTQRFVYQRRSFAPSFEDVEPPSFLPSKAYKYSESFFDPAIKRERLFYVQSS